MPCLFAISVQLVNYVPKVPRFRIGSLGMMAENVIELEIQFVLGRGDGYNVVRRLSAIEVIAPR
jgi:hypothetical protein